MSRKAKRKNNRKGDFHHLWNHLCFSSGVHPGPLQSTVALFHLVVGVHAECWNHTLFIESSPLTEHAQSLSLNISSMHLRSQACAVLPSNEALFSDGCPGGCPLLPWPWQVPPFLHRRSWPPPKLRSWPRDRHWPEFAGPVSTCSKSVQTP